MADSRDHDHAACQATIDRLARELADVRRELAEKDIALAESREELLGALRRGKHHKARADAAEERAERLGRRWRRAAEIAFTAGRTPHPTDQEDTQ